MSIGPTDTRTDAASIDWLFGTGVGADPAPVAPSRPLTVPEIMALHREHMARTVGTLAIRNHHGSSPAVPDALRALAAELRRQEIAPERHPFFAHPVAHDDVGADPSTESDASWSATAYDAIENALKNWAALTASPGQSTEDAARHVAAIVDTLDGIIAGAQQRHLDVIASAAKKARDLITGPIEDTRNEGFVLALVLLLGGLYLFSTGGGQGLLHGYAKGVPDVARGFGEGIGHVGRGVGTLAAGGGYALAKVA